MNDLRIEPSGQTLGAKIHGVDLSRPLTDIDFAKIVQALGHYGVVCFPEQSLDAVEQKRFSARFGGLEVNVANMYQVPDHPEVMILSNIKKDGKPIGIGDAGQGWHTDMSYSKTIAFANVLHAITIPRRDGRALGGTQFANMHQAYEDLPEALKRKLDGMTIEHDFNKFWEMMRQREGSLRQPLTEEQRKKKPPVSHPIFLTHPITGKKVLYANPGYAMKINELSEKESQEILEFLFQHQLQDKYIYTHDWNEGDVLMWENIGTLHNALSDYGPDEHRYIQRCQVMADWIFESPFAVAVGADKQTV
jgi:taurine dioxygenase